MNIKIPQPTKKGYIELPPGSVFDAAYPGSKTRRGRVQGGGQICPTLQCSCEPLLYEGANNQQFLKIMDNNINLPEELKGKKFRIRKLTPKERFRLMGVVDDDINKMQASGLSNSAQYKLAGNSIVVDVLYHIFRKLLVETQNEDTQPTLF